MAGPPDNVDPTALWLALTAVPRPHRIVDMPRKLPGTDTPVGKIAIWPLTQEEQMICNAEADRFAKQMLKEGQRKEDENLGYRGIYSNETAIQVLFRSCRDADDLSRGAFPSTKLMRQTFTADEVTLLFELYIGVQLEVGPIIAYLTHEEMEAWIQRLEEGGSALPLALLAPQALNNLVLFMASQVVSSWTVTTSPGSPPDDGQTDPLEAPDEGEPITAPT